MSEVVEYDPEAIAHTLQEWARTKPFVRRLWIFGSRARQDFRPESDLDIAIEVNAVGRDPSPYTSFFFCHSEWREDLQSRVPYEVHLAHYNPGCDPELSEAEGNVVKSVNRSNRLIFDRDQEA